MRRYFPIIFLIIFLAAVPSGGAGEVIRVGVYENVPLSYLDNSGQARGFFIDLLDHIAEQEGWQVVHVPGSWPQCLENLQKGKIDLLGVIAHSPERARIFDYSYESVFTDWGQVYTKPRGRVESLIDLQGKKIAVLKDDIYYRNLRKMLDQFEVKSRFIEAFENEDVLGLVEIGKCDVGLVNQSYGFHHESRYQIAKTPIILSPQRLFWATPKNRSRELLFRLDRHMKRLKGAENSFYFRSLEKWFGIGTKFVLPPWLRWVLPGMALLVFLAGSTLWIFRHQLRLRTRELVESEEKYRTLFETESDAIFLIEKDSGRILEVNSAGAALYGFSREELISMKNTDLSAEPDQTSRATREKAGKIPVRYHKKRDGTVFPVEITATHLLWQGKEAHIAAIRDITFRLESEKEHAKLKAQLLKSQKMESLGTLAGGIAHDFNNILASVIGYTELSIDDAEGNPRLKENLKEILAAGLRAKNLVRQILTFSRRNEQPKTPTRLTAVIGEASRMLRAAISANIAIEVGLRAEEDTVLADATQIHQVVMNLCTNAAQAMATDGGNLRLVVENASWPKEISGSAERAPMERCLKLTVSDTGQGIAEEHLQRIFDPYFTTKEVGKGTGLGLSVVHGIVESHGGRVTVRSAAGRGTTFDVYLPLMPKEARPTLEVAEKAVSDGSGHILFVDDENQILDFSRAALERLGYTVTAAASSQAGLEAFRAAPDRFAAVITDMTMPGMSGDRLALEIKTVRPDLPVIISTGFSERISPETAVQMGLDGFLMKPVQVGELARALKAVLNQSVP